MIWKKEILGSRHGAHTYMNITIVHEAINAYLYVTYNATDIWGFLSELGCQVARGGVCGWGLTGEAVFSTWRENLQNASRSLTPRRVPSMFLAKLKVPHPRPHLAPPPLYHQVDEEITQTELHDDCLATVIVSFRHRVILFLCCGHFVSPQVSFQHPLCPSFCFD